MSTWARTPEGDLMNLEHVWLVFEEDGRVMAQPHWQADPFELAVEDMKTFKAELKAGVTIIGDVP